MPYSTQTDLIVYISQAELIQLTDDAGIGVIDAAIVTQAIADADAEIDAYLMANYPVPLSPIPAIVRRMSVDLGIYHLFGRRNIDLPVNRVKRHDDTLALLSNIAQGLVTIGSPAPAEVAFSSPQATRLSSDRVFTMDTMGAY